MVPYPAEFTHNKLTRNEKVIHYFFSCFCMFVKCVPRHTILETSQHQYLYLVSDTFLLNKEVLLANAEFFSCLTCLLCSFCIAFFCVTALKTLALAVSGWPMTRAWALARWSHG